MSIITDCPYICAPNIMDTPDYTTKTVVLDMTGKTVIKAGTPISADGKVANDETAIGILLQDCHACLGTCRGLVVISGRIKQDVAKNHSGVTISDEAKAALINITFTGDGARAGGGGVATKYILTIENTDPKTYTIAHEDGSAVTPQEVHDAFMSGPVMLEVGNDNFHEDSHVTSIDWQGSSPAAVEGVAIFATGAQAGSMYITIGDVSMGS